MSTTPHPATTNRTIADGINFREASKWPGKKVSDFCQAHGLNYTGLTESEIQTRRANATIAAMRIKKGFGARIHFLSTDGEWITLTANMLLDLSATDKERREWFGDAAEQYPDTVHQK